MIVNGYVCSVLNLYVLGMGGSTCGRINAYGDR